MQKMPAALRFVPPMECKNVERIPEGAEWQYELKLDGYRAIAVNLPETKGAHRMDREKMKKTQWVKPGVVCEIAFNERTANGHLRHSRFLRLRDEFDRRRSAND
jgi:ATP-dependent DNA ligase